MRLKQFDILDRALYDIKHMSHAAIGHDICHSDMRPESRSSCQDRQYNLQGLCIEGRNFDTRQELFSVIHGVWPCAPGHQFLDSIVDKWGTHGALMRSTCALVALATACRCSESSFDPTGPPST